MAGDERHDQGDVTRSSRTPLLVAVVLVVVLGVFVVQNTESTEVTWLVFDRAAPLWLVILIAAVAGALLTEVAGWLMRRRRRD